MGLALAPGGNPGIGTLPASVEYHVYSTRNCPSHGGEMEDN